MNRQDATTRDYTAERLILETKKDQLEAQIRDSIDPVAQALLRKDYRAVINSLEMFYNDEPESETT
jgi:hypothetical protein